MVTPSPLDCGGGPFIKLNYNLDAGQPGELGTRQHPSSP